MFLLSTSCAATKETVVEKGSVVAFEYTLTDENGKVIESSKGRDPLTYTQGQGRIISGLESELLGMQVGGERNVVVKPEDAYGPVDPKAFHEVPKEKLPPQSLKVGTTLMTKSSDGQQLRVRVHEIRENTVIVDLNHPLAGKTLSFDVKILSLKPPEAK